MRTHLPATLGVAALAIAGSAAAESPYKHLMSNDPGRCAGGSPAVKVDIRGIAPAKGMLRVQLYRGTESDWLVKGHWLARVEIPVRGGLAAVCMPVPAPGTYAIAVRHDVNGDGRTEIRSDGGGMSNNPPISILNLGKPGYKETAFEVGGGVKTIAIRMRYF